MRAQFVIVGGGVMGTAIAMAVARRCDPLSEPVVLVEKSSLAAGSSGSSGAILRQHYSSRELAGMARDCLREYGSFYRRTGRWIGFRRSGVLALAGPERPEFMEQVRRNVEMQRSIGIDTRIVEADEIRELVPGIEVGDRVIAAYEPGGGFVDPVLTVEAFGAVAREAGATTRIGTAVTGFVVREGRLRAVETDAGEIETEKAVVAAGPWTCRLMERAGVELPLTAIQPEQFFLSMPTPAAPAHPEEDREAQAPPHEAEDPRFAAEAHEEPEPAHAVLLDLERNVYGRCEARHGRTRSGRLDYHGSPEVDPDRLEPQVSPEFAAWARSELSRRMPVYADRDEVVGLPGVYTLTPDAQALIGPVPEVAGLWVVSGFSGHGFKLAPAVGEGVTQMLFEEPVSAFDPAFFDPARFVKGASEASGAFGL